MLFASHSPRSEKKPETKTVAHFCNGLHCRLAMTSLKLPLQITVDKHESRAELSWAGLLVGRRSRAAAAPAAACAWFRQLVTTFPLSSLKLKEKTATFPSRRLRLWPRLTKRVCRIAFEFRQSSLHYVSKGTTYPRDSCFKNVS